MIAWVGLARDVAEPLNKIVMGTYDGQSDSVRFELHRAIARERNIETEMNGRVRIAQSKQAEFSDPKERIAFLRKSIEDFEGYPEVITLSKAIMNTYREIPGSKQEAYDHAMNLAVDAISEPNPFFYYSSCSNMLTHFEYSSEEDKDPRLVELAFLVLTHPDASKNHIRLSESQDFNYRLRYAMTLARAHQLRGDIAKARAALEEALLAANSRKKEKPEKWNDEDEHRLIAIEEQIASLNDL